MKQVNPMQLRWRMPGKECPPQSIATTPYQLVAAFVLSRKTMAQKLQQELTKFRRMQVSRKDVFTSPMRSFPFVRYFQSKYKERLEVNSQPPTLPLGKYLCILVHFPPSDQSYRIAGNDNNDVEETSAAAQLQMVDQVLPTILFFGDSFGLISDFCCWHLHRY